MPNVSIHNQFDCSHTIRTPASKDPHPSCLRHASINNSSIISITCDFTSIFYSPFISILETIVDPESEENQEGQHHCVKGDKDP